MNLLFVQTLKTPWLAILTSIPVWALLIAQCSQAWGFWMLLAKTPAYMDNALGYKIQEVKKINKFDFKSIIHIGINAKQRERERKIQCVRNDS